MVSFALEGITSFSVKPIRWVTMLGLVSLVVSLVMMVYTLVQALAGRVVAGWSSLMISIWLVGGLVMLSLGVVGEYVGRIVPESKGRPRYIVAGRPRAMRTARGKCHEGRVLSFEDESVRWLSSGPLDGSFPAGRSLRSRLSCLSAPCRLRCTP